MALKLPPLPVNVHIQEIMEMVKGLQRKQTAHVTSSMNELHIVKSQLQFMTTKIPLFFKVYSKYMNIFTIIICFLLVAYSVGVVIILQRKSPNDSDVRLYSMYHDVVYGTITKIVTLLAVTVTFRAIQKAANACV
jgi:hypothetical protein